MPTNKELLDRLERLEHDFELLFKATKCLAEAMLCDEKIREIDMTIYKGREN